MKAVQLDDRSEGQTFASLTERIRGVRDHLAEGLVERDVAVRLALLAALAGEHLILVGPPGTAKSQLARRLQHLVRGATFFERLLTRFTVPEDLFGPLSIKALEDDRYERQTSAYLPSSSVAFLDEIFKANSAILNALLSLLNERVFDNGARRERTPLIAVVGASNELPEDAAELAALYDRFLLRLHVAPVSDGGFVVLLALRGQAEPSVLPELQFDLEELREIRDRAEREVEVPADVVALLQGLRQFCAAEHIEVSDRRWRKALALLQVSAFTNGRAQVSVWDAWLLQHCLWTEPDQHQKLYDWYASRVGASVAMDPARLTKLVVSLEAALKRDQDARSQKVTAQGEAVFLDVEDQETTAVQGQVPLFRGKKPLFMAPECVVSNHYSYSQVDRTNGKKGYTLDELDALTVRDARGEQVRFSEWDERDRYCGDVRNRWMTRGELRPALEPTRHPAVYVEHRLAELDRVRRDIVQYQSDLARHTQSLETDIRGHLWVTDDFVGPAAAALRDTATVVASLLQRLDAVREGFAGLPRLEDSPAEVPPARQA